MSDEPFPGSPDDMMNTIAALRARVAELEAALTKIRDNDPITDEQPSPAKPQHAGLHDSREPYSGQPLSQGDDAVAETQSQMEQRELTQADRKAAIAQAQAFAGRQNVGTPASPINETSKAQDDAAIARAALKDTPQ